jgi:hypothetical protein
VEEYRRPEARPNGAIIPAQHTDDIVERIVAPQHLGAGVQRQVDLQIVVGMSRVVTPAIRRHQRLHRHDADRRLDPIRAEQYAPQGQDAERGGAVALALVWAQTAASRGCPERFAANSQIAGGQDGTHCD